MEKPTSFKRFSFTLSSEAWKNLKLYAMNNCMTDSKALDTILIATSTENKDEKITILNGKTRKQKTSGKISTA